MATPISNISQLAQREAGTQPAVGRSGGKLPFADLVSNLVKQTNAEQLQVEDKVQELVTGQTDSIHDVVLSASQADLAFRLVMEVRDQLIASYQDVMRMQV